MKMKWFLIGLFAIQGLTQERVPQANWLHYADPAEAGFDPLKLQNAEATWETLPSSAFMIVADGAVVAAWGDVERRFMCHSVRKSFMSAVYGIFWDQQRIDLNKTLADLGIDDMGEGLLESEKQARILDLLKARSGVFHPAAYAGRTDSQPRGSQGPGRYFAYNNWDFNTLVTILEQETGEKFFQAFDQYFGQPLGMQDWHVSHGYYHYELDKSMHPAYPFRMSARDAARFGLLFARRGQWGEQRILSRDWVQRSTALYSIDSEALGYGMLWWVAREPRFKPYGLVAALGVGNQMIAVLPELDMVIVNRANTFQGEGTPMGPLLDLIESVIESRQREPIAEPQLRTLAVGDQDPRFRLVPDQELAQYVGEWDYPPPLLGLPVRSRVHLTVNQGSLIAHSPQSGTFRLYLQDNGDFLEEDSLRLYLTIPDSSGQFAGLAQVAEVCQATLTAFVSDKDALATQCLNRLSHETDTLAVVTRSLIGLLKGDEQPSMAALQEAVTPKTSARIENAINNAGYALMQVQKLDAALKIFQANTLLFPQAFNTWDSLAEAYMNQGKLDDALSNYEKSLDLNPRNENAKSMITRLKESSQKAP